MADQNASLLWTRADWRKQADGWIAAQLERLGMQAAGPVEQPHIRPWSTVLRVPTQEGVLYFKAALPAYSQYEVALTAALARWIPQGTPVVLAADPERCWMLMTDGGISLRKVLQAEGDIRHWHNILPLYAGMQQELSAHLSDLLAMGVPDRRLEALPGLYTELLADPDVVRIDQPEGLTSVEYGRLRAFQPQFAALCAQLAAYGIPETLQHDDLHDNNILVREGRYQLFDWGDSCISHPFFTLVVVFRSVERTLAREPDDPELALLRDLYLEQWTRYAPLEALQRAYGLAHRIGMVCRALTWRRVLPVLEKPWKTQYGGEGAGWLKEFLDHEHQAG
jgi:hypothetical protein